MTNLQDILEPFHIRGCRELPNDKYDDCKKTRAEAQAAIAELVGSCLPEKIENDPLGNDSFIAGSNAAIDQIRNNLIKAGVLNG